MAAINCPNCRALVSLDESLAGEPLICPSCGARFSIPPIVGQPEPLVEFNPYARAFKRRLQRPTSFWDIFDFKFEKYLTPWIIRATWVCFCLLAALYFVFWGISSIADAVESDRPRPAKVVKESADSKEPEIQWSFGGSRFTEIGNKIAYVVLQVVAVIFALLWVRVVLETEIVIFNIAMGIASIDRKIKKQE